MNEKHVVSKIKKSNTIRRGNRSVFVDGHLVRQLKLIFISIQTESFPTGSPIAVCTRK